MSSTLAILAVVAIKSASVFHHSLAWAAISSCLSAYIVSNTQTSRWPGQYLDISGHYLIRDVM